MKFLITDYFLKTIPNEKYNKILEKLYFFYNVMKKNKILSLNLPKGYWIKKIRGSKFLYEFRVDNGDRIFFLLNSIFRDNNSENIVFLIYSSHDMAIKKAKRKEILEMNMNEFILFDEEDNILEIDELFFNYNNMISYEIMNDEDFKNNFFDKKFRYYYLNDEQYGCLLDMPPYFVTGSAGSGKSTITLRKLLNLEENRNFYNISKILYITANRYLKDNSYEQYIEFRKSTTENEIAEFFTVKEFFCTNLGISKKQIVDFQKFNKFFMLSFPNKKRLSLSIEEIYSEINGVLKGLMIKDKPDNWDRDLTSDLINFDDYISLSSKYSTLKMEEKKLLYKIAKKYSEWLKNYNYYDLNDLARKIIEKNISYDFIIIDEIQDLTELQIYALISIVKNKENVFFSGDIHQMVNATVFSFERVKNLFYSKYNKKINIKILSKNYRSCKKIVDLANYFAVLRAKYIGNLGIEDYKELSIQQEGEINLTKFNLQLIEEAQNNVNSAIVVADIKEKYKLLENLNNKHRVFTIQEIKGLEYNNIICYNLSSNYSKQWENIFSKDVKHNQKYRKYFNIFYVGITRARKRLIIMEDEIENNSVLKELHNFLTQSNEIYIDKEQINTQNEKEDWLKEGIKLFKMEQLEEAQYAFEKANEPTWILERDIENLIKTLQFKTAINKLKKKSIKNKVVYYRKLIIDTAIKHRLYLVATECNQTFGILYRDKEIKDEIKKAITENSFSQEQLKKIINIYKKKKDSNFVADLLLQMNHYKEALSIYQNLNNSHGIHLARTGILKKYFDEDTVFQNKIDELNDIIFSKNINSFDKKDRLTPLHRTIILKKDPILFDMVLYLGGNLNTYVKGGELVPFYCLGKIHLEMGKKLQFFNILKKHGFDFNNKAYFPIYLKYIKLFKFLINEKGIDIVDFKILIEKKLDEIKDVLISKKKRKLLLFKQMIKNIENH